MRSMVKLIFAMAVLGTSVAANAQTYDVNIDLGVGKNDPIDFSGTLFLDQNGSLSNVDVRAPFDLGVFTAASVRDLGKGREAVTLYDFEGHSGTSLPRISLTFDVGKPLGSSRDIGVGDVLIGIDGNFSEPYRCGREHSQFAITCSGSVTYAGGAPAAAPEIDSRFATEGMLLLAGGLMVLRARRIPSDRAVG